ncbi:MAG TPA: oxalyl-CoA decarboxylase [Acidimicrobiia bacterium]|nr:oxalyl-CoA decarboxylase [Acidimicrobiia bacterium]
MPDITGATVLARSLKQQGVDYMFGIVGFPVIPVANAAQREGITFIGMHNEQAAAYAAQAAGYLTGRPQSCLVVSGPGVIHALGGLANARENCWPMLLVGGASETYQAGMGAFQEERQVLAATPYSKYAMAIDRVDRIPYYVEQAVRTSLYGRPGPAYLDMADDIIRGTASDDAVPTTASVPPPPRPQAAPADIDAALAALQRAERPLVIIGKGMAWARAEAEVREFIERTQLPFLATPMGKGVVSDAHPASVGAARSYALKNADLVLLLGARLNWMLHFGLPPRFAPDVKVVQIDIAAEQVGHNVPAEVALVGDGRSIMTQLNAALAAAPWSCPGESAWRDGIARKSAENATAVAGMANDDRAPMNYYRALRDLREAMPADAIIVSEGANTMDIGRTQLPNSEPRTRLDAGTYGTMGVGLGFAVAAAVTNPGRPVIALEGDSAFGFSGMEMETICRYNLPVTVVIFNNGGIVAGMVKPPAPGEQLPPYALSRTARYEQLAEAFGGRGFYVEKPSDLRPALDKAISSGGPSIVNVLLDARADRKPQEHFWKA